MKKAVFVLILIFAMSCVASDLFAKGIGVKAGYAKMRDDYVDFYEDTWAFGIYADMGTFLFDKLRFRPSFDYLKLEHEDEATHHAWTWDLYGLHLDWYWFFMGEKQLAPFLGFGFGLNFLSYDGDSDDEDDSEAGLEMFVGTDINLSGPLSLMIELRYAMVDIANREQNMFKLNLGALYKF